MGRWSRWPCSSRRCSPPGSAGRPPRGPTSRLRSRSCSRSAGACRPTSCRPVAPPPPGWWTSRRSAGSACRPSAGSRSPRVVTRTCSAGPADVAADHHAGCPASRCSSSRSRAAADLPGAAASRPGCRSPAPGRRAAAAASRSAMTSHGLSRSDSDSTQKSWPERRARPGWPPPARRSGRAAPGPATSRHGSARRPPPAPRLAIANTPGSPEETTATRRPRCGQLQRERGPLGLHPVVGGVPALARVGRHPVQVGAVADQVVGGGQRGLRLGGQPRAGRPGRARPRPPRRGAPAALAARAARRGPGVPPGSGSSASEKYGTLVRVDLGQRRRCAAAPVVARSTYQASSSRPASVQRRRAPRRRCGRASAPRPSRCRPAARRAPRPGSVPGSTVRTSSRSTSGRPSTAAAALTEVTPGTTSVGVPVRQPLVHVHVGAVEERVALGTAPPRRGRRPGGRPAARRAAA